MSAPRTSRRRTRRPDISTVVKDAISYLLGLGLIVHQAVFVPRQDFNLALTLLGAALIGVPGVSQLLASRIGGPPLREPQEDSRPPPLSSSSAPPGAER